MSLLHDFRRFRFQAKQPSRPETCTTHETTTEMSTDTVQGNPTRVLFREHAQRLYDAPIPHKTKIEKVYRELYEDHLIFLLLADQAKQSGSSTAVPELRPQLKNLLDRSEEIVGAKECASLYPGWDAWRQVARGGMGWNQEQKFLSSIQETWTPVLHGLLHLGQGFSLGDTAALVDQKWKELEAKRHNRQQRLC